jgi:hypothetical protein
VSENLNLVRGIYAAWERGDFSVTDWMDPEIEVVVVSELLPVSAKGPVELARVWSEVMNPYEGYRVEAVDFREIDDERVLVLAEQSGAAKQAEYRSAARERTCSMRATGRSSSMRTVAPSSPTSTWRGRRCRRRT